MSQGDSWVERYLSVIPEKLSAADAKVLIELMCEDPERLAVALQTFAAEGVEEDEIEMERGQRATWDEAFRRLLAEAGMPVEDTSE